MPEKSYLLDTLFNLNNITINLLIKYNIIDTIEEFNTLNKFSKQLYIQQAIKNSTDQEKQTLLSLVNQIKFQLDILKN